MVKNKTCPLSNAVKTHLLYKQLWLESQNLRKKECMYIHLGEQGEEKRKCLCKEWPETYE